MLSKVFKSISGSVLAAGNRLLPLVIDYQRVNTLKKHFNSYSLAKPLAVSTSNSLPKSLEIILIIYVEFLGFLS